MAEKNALAAFKAALKKDTDRLYVFADKEPWFRDKCCEELTAAVVGDDDMNLVTLDGDTLTPEELSDAVDMPPVFAERKFIHVRRFHPAQLTAEDADLYISILKDIPDYAVLLIELAEPARKGKNTEGGGGSASFARALSSLTTVYEFETPSPDEMAKLIIRTFREAEKSISPADAAYFVSLSAGSDTQQVMSEAEKLLSVPHHDITRADIDSLVSLSPDAASYLISNAIFEGNLAEALSLFRAQIKKGSNEYILSSILFGDMRRYYAVKLGTAENVSSDKLCSLLSIRENRLFVLRKIVSRVDILRLRRAVSLCVENEYKLRSSSEDGVLMTEMLLMKLCILLGRAR
ncbi:MAG: DNA polymerase III subunit delta [Clostridia bacterium]|nr:DNA polymerase III subunit delta [Clostridia bacterium]